jgi:hypothetical protein
LLAGSFASSPWGKYQFFPNYNTSPYQSFVIGYGVDNAPPVFDPGQITPFSFLRGDGDTPAQGAKTIFKILRKGIDYTTGSQQITLFVAAPDGNQGPFNYMYNFETNLALIPVV